MPFYALAPIGFLTPLAQIAIVAGLFIWTTLWQYGEYRRTGKMYEDYPLSISILFVPIYEEFIFRGLILFYLVTIYSPIFAIIISSLLFGLWHLKNIFFLSRAKLTGQILYAGFFVGPVAAIITLWSGTIWIAVVLHYLNNLLAPQINKIIKKNK
jgi:membrane protease YdiL (CAAX protease family)